MLSTMHELANCRLKIGRAKEHFDALGAELAAWAKTESMRVVKEVREDGREHRVFVEIIDYPPLDRWASMAGDCVHNLRSALDSLLYGIAIYQTGLNPPSDEKVIQFPIVTDSTKFKGQSYRIRSLSDSVKNEIEKLQPYNRPHADLPPLLELLNVLSNQDKHRTLNVVVASVHSASIEIPAPPHGPKLLSVTPIRAAIRGKTEILSFRVEPPSPALQYKCIIRIPICLQHSPGPSKSPFNELATVLHWLIDEVETVVGILAAVI
jgi:hypothetical protein